MTWLSEWRALAARSEGLFSTNDILLRARAINPHDLSGGVMYPFVKPALERLIAAIGGFHDAYGDTLPGQASAVLAGFLERARGLSLSSMDILGLAQVTATIHALKVELDYYFSDGEVAARRLVERAFLHLQRSLAADEGLRQRWIAAKGEVGCEKLGALHLLAHGVWAFKADAVGARTDLILGTPLSQDEPRASDVEALVLTEWKLAKATTDIRGKMDEAHKQLALYHRGALGGFELSTRRYVVMVVDQHTDLPDDHDEGGVLCRHVLLARSGETPSVTARRDS